jgi:hypothetical protein
MRANPAINASVARRYRTVRSRESDRRSTRPSHLDERHGGSEPFRHVLDPDRDDERDTELVTAGCERHSNRESLWDTVDGQRRQKQYGALLRWSCGAATLGETGMNVGNHEIDEGERDRAGGESEQHVG